MRTLPGTLGMLVDRAITKPAHLVLLSFPTPVRLCTGPDVFSMGYTWVGDRECKISGLDNNHNGKVTLDIDDSDLLITATVLNAPIAGIAASIYTIDRDSPEDAVQVFQGYMDDPEIGVDEPVVKIRLTNSVLKAPRRLLNASSGANVVLPSGTQITFNGQTYTLER